MAMKTLFAAAIAVSMLTGTVTTAYADHDRGRHERSYVDHKDHHKHKHLDRGHHRDHRPDLRDAYRAGYRDGRADQRRYDRGRYIPPRGYHVRAWRRGDYLPRSYYEPRYVVHDYHVYHLSPPPRGHHWVRVNNDVVLAAIASGLVVSVVNGLFY
jgi:Ni/Co efflux regulator RcnB